MKAMSLRMRMQTLSPCVTPSRSRPPAMRAARFPTSAWPRLRWPLMMPWKRCELSVIAFFLILESRRPRMSAFALTREVRALASLEGWQHGVEPSFEARKKERAPQDDGSNLSNTGNAPRALFDVGADRLELVGSAHQFHLLDGFGQQRRTGIGGKIVQHAFGGTDRFRALARDLARNFEGGGARGIADPGRQAVTQRLLRRENPPGIGQFAQDIVAHEARQDRCSRHVLHQPPFDLHDRHPRIRAKKAHIGAERELKAAAERHALDRGNHRHRKLPPSPHRGLRKIGQPMGARGQIALFAARDPVAARFLHRGETAHIEAGAERPPLAGQYYRPQAFFTGEPLGSGDQRIEHRGIQGIHLVRPHQSDVGDAFGNRNLDAILHCEFSHALLRCCRFTEWRWPDLVNQAINRHFCRVEISMFSDNLLADRRILVTGGGTGLGKSMAARFLELGAEVHICGRRKGVCDETATELMDLYGGRGTRHGVDIRNPLAVDEMIETIFQEGPPTALINNAAGNFISRTEDLTPRGFDAVANIVMHGTFYVTHAVGRRWIAGGHRGNVVSITVTWVRNGSPYVVPSAMSKSAIHAMTMSLATEWGRYGIRLNTIAPGEIPTEGMSKRLNPGDEAGARTIARNPMGRVGKMEELQNLAVFLISGGCDWINGETIAMDGAQGLATGGNFYELRDWSDADWTRARDSIKAQNEKDRAARGGGTASRGPLLR